METEAVGDNKKHVSKVFRVLEKKKTKRWRQYIISKGSYFEGDNVVTDKKILFEKILNIDYFLMTAPI